MAQAMNETKSDDAEKLIAHLEKGAQFDILKARKGYFRDWDHQMMQEQYTVRLKPKAQVKDKWDLLALGRRGAGAQRAAGERGDDAPGERLHAVA